ncbi:MULTISPECIES: SDR family NAD(P)-dependent oxidoreductase [Streptomyces]|uniref:SDR family NAD(P)-dependent oxidoreductase n=2 Tax=Streptomyces TaxID=1883 RepID=A0ABY6EH57_9ACTN|nr:MULTISPECIES: SDR family NAD(P)-dependent oxidoreductase [unclassified Streptomyces]OKJ81097.1 oxidoreductase [Streptomyces sp. CB01883]ROP55418.1 short-subunit dehydrogenase [Streptomyces sp. PanSC9]UXY33798.1 SDR family NAD(P)-dependent oxidoreductase [Streptomyces sp. HUAS 14-6]
MHIAGATVLLTGVTGGIGSALAAGLSDRGARLILTGRRREALEPLAERYGARTVLADLADPDDVRRLAEEAAGTDILVANAALPSSGDVLDYTPEQIDRAFAVNLRAPAVLARLLAPGMVAAGRGHVCFVGSLSGMAATKSSTMYNASKFGLRGFSLAFRQDLHGTGVGVSIVQPGFVRDLGMFAKTGSPTPGGVRTVSPDRVVRGVARAIERDVAELNVAPLELRFLTKVASQFPGFAERVQRLAGADRTVDTIVAAQRASR